VKINQESSGIAYNRTAYIGPFCLQVVNRLSLLKLPVYNTQLPILIEMIGKIEKSFTA
jgi:hypothetical protein